MSQYRTGEVCGDANVSALSLLAKPKAWAVSALCSLLLRLPRRSAPRNDSD
ncbi:MAG: hypothetical protein WC121_12410 [Candidatus Kapaibacterium sp.]